MVSIIENILVLYRIVKCPRLTANFYASYYVSRRGGTQQAISVKLSKAENTSTAIGLMDESFKDFRKALLNFTEAFGLQYGVKFVNTLFKENVWDTMLLGLPFNTNSDTSVL